MSQKKTTLRSGIKRTKLSPNRSDRRESVKFIGLHWTGGGFSSAVNWCLNPDSEVSYHYIIDKDGNIQQLVDEADSAWSVGVSRSFYPQLKFASGNHASINIALAGAPHLGPVTQKQIDAAVSLASQIYKDFDWSTDDIDWRILGHSQVAVFRKGHKQAGQLGRKPDPDGQGWLDLHKFRLAVKNLL